MGEAGWGGEVWGTKARVSVVESVLEGRGEVIQHVQGAVTVAHQRILRGHDGVTAVQEVSERPSHAVDEDVK